MPKINPQAFEGTAEQHVAYLAGLLKKYGRHESTCAAGLFTPKPCNCGWDAAKLTVPSEVGR